MSRLKRTAEEEAILAKAAKYLPGGSTGNIFFKPEDAMIIKEALGSKVWDYSGNEYIDFLLGSGPMLVGHSHPDVVAAVLEVIGKGSTYFSTNGAAVELAEEMVNAIPVRRAGAVPLQRLRGNLFRYEGCSGIPG